MKKKRFIFKYIITDARNNLIDSGNTLEFADTLSIAKKELKNKFIARYGQSINIKLY